MLCCPPLGSGRSACPARLRAPLDPPPSLVAPSSLLPSSLRSSVQSAAAPFGSRGPGPPSLVASLLGPVGGGALWLAGARTSFPRRFAPLSRPRPPTLARLPLTPRPPSPPSTHT